jgi:hypothetical protein
LILLDLLATISLLLRRETRFPKAVADLSALR